MSRNTGGTYALPTGNPVVSGTTITATWANNTFGDISSEITDSLSRSGKGAMLAPLKMANGTAAAPSLTWDADPDSGLYRAGEGDVRMQVDATQTQKWTAAGVTIPVALTASGGATLSGTNTLSGATTISGATTLSGTIVSAPTIDVGAEALRLKPGALDYVYLSLYADSAAPNTRSAYLGYTGAGQTELTLVNEIASGDVRITASSGKVVVGTQQLKMDGGNPASSTAISNTLTAMNTPKAWANVTTAGGGSTSVTVNAGFNVTGAVVSGTGTSLVVTFASAFASTSYCVTANAEGPVVLFCFVASKTTTTATILAYDAAGTAYDFDAGGASAITVNIVVFGAQ